MKRIFAIIIAAIAMHAGITTSAYAGEWDIGANSRMRQEALAVGRVVEGVVIQARNIDLAPTPAANTVSTGLGGLIGAALGSQAGKGNGKYVGGVIGAVLGGIAGNAVGEKVSSATAQELIIRKSDGGLIVITQSESALNAGQAVYLTESNGRVRVIPQHVPGATTIGM